MRLAISYESGLYFRCNIQQPWHPDRLIESVVGSKSTDSGMGCGYRDIGFERYSGNYQQMMEKLKELDFGVRVKIFDRNKQGNLELKTAFSVAG